MATERSYRKVAVYKGGISSEREVSLESGRAVANGLRSAGYAVEEVDVVDRAPPIPDGAEAVFIALHGAFGEDGGVQSYLRDRRMPYTGSGPEGSRAAFDKQATKEILRDNEVVTAPFEILRPGQRRSLRLPVVVKPTREGSSIGISRVFAEAEWDAAIEKGFQYGGEVVVEQYVEGRECTVGIVGGEAMPIVEIIPRDGYYNYNAKYRDAATRYQVPADLPAAVADQCRAAAKRMFDLLGCRGFARIDFLVDADGNAHVLELNSIPGFTEHSLLPKAARAAGIEFPRLCDRIMRLAAL